MSDETTPADVTPPPLERRLATILSADVVGYSRLMGEDEEGTVQTLRGHRAVFDALLAQHHGRVFNTAGDAILAEFPSAVEAVRCATEIQAALQTRNEHLPPERRMLFRMGINLGDVVVQQGDLLGDGVNVAARLQSIAEPGGINISGSVYDQIQNKLSLQFMPLGNRQLKNISQPVRTFTIAHGERGALPVARRVNGWVGRAIVGGAAVVVLAVLAAGGYWVYSDRETKRAAADALNAQLAAEKKAAEDARLLAQEQTRRAVEAEARAERDRLAAEAAKLEADLKAQLQAADDARRRAEAERKRIDEERQAAADKRTPEEKRAADARGETGKGSGGVLASLANALRGGPKVGPVNATYDGEFCNFPADAGRKMCWRVALKFQDSIASPSWPSRVKGKFANARVTVDGKGEVAIAIDGWNTNDGSALTAALAGRLVDDRIEAQGRWANGAPVEGHWKRAQ
jgi:class 3 adenylate cyclase